MTIKSLFAVAAAFSLAAAPTLAQAAPMASPAASVANVRAGAPSAHADKLAGRGGGFLIAVLVGAALIALAAVAITNNGNDSPDSP